MDSEDLLDAMKTIESELVSKGGDHLDITQDREFSNPNFHRLHIVDMLKQNRIERSIYVSHVIFKPVQEEIDETIGHIAPW